MSLARVCQLFALVLISGCATASAPEVVVEPHPRAKNVLLVYNTKFSDGIQIVKAYQQARGVPDSNVVAISVTTDDNIGWSEYEATIVEKVRDHIASKKLKIDFIVLTKGVPLRLNNDGGYGLDSMLAVDAHPSRKEKPLDPMPMSNFTQEDFARIQSPYFGKDEPFDSDKFGFYLVTRLDGYTTGDAIALISRALRAKPEKGEFLLDSAPDKTSGGYASANQSLFRARDVLQQKGFGVALDEGAAFVGGRHGLMGYASWGSNDSAFTLNLYRSLQFSPGALAETFVSTSARTFRPVTGGQSLIADLIQQGVTGVKGYASEPYTIALARVDILFDRYTSGRNLAESFYAASPMLKWKDVVIGDPLCAPYAAQ